MNEQPEVTADPARLELAGPPGSEWVTTTMHVTNSGSAAVTLDLPQTIMLRRSDALALGIRRAFKGTNRDVVSRLIKLGEHLKRDATIEAPLRCEGAPSALEPGETRGIDVRIRVPEDLDRSVSWVGTVPRQGGGGLVTLVVPADRARPRADPRDEGEPPAEG